MSEKLINLVQNALSEINKQDVSISTLINVTIRIARLNNDYEFLLWLKFQNIDHNNDSIRHKAEEEISNQYSPNDYRNLFKRVKKLYVEERRICVWDEKLKKFVDKGKIIVTNISEVENRYYDFKKQADESKPPDGLHPIDLYFEKTNYENQKVILNRMSHEYLNVLNRIRNRIQDYLSITEKQIICNERQSQIFESSKKYVDSKIKKWAPDIFDQFNKAFTVITENDNETYSYALLSCRRVLKSVADRLYPPSSKQIKCWDGKERMLSDDKYINRLIQFLSENLPRTKTKQLAITQLEDLSNRIGSLQELSSKGVHDNVSLEEVHQCMIQTYFTVADILRVAEKI